MHRLRSLLPFVPLIMGILPLAGCQSSSDAELAPSQSTAESNEPAPMSSNPSAPASDAKGRLLGSWDGAFQLNEDAPLEAFDEATIDICKSIRMLVVFHADDRLQMSASMTLPEIGQQTTETSGTWGILSQNGDEIQLQAFDSEGEPEDVTVVFLDDNSFTMTPPNELRDLGILKFNRN